MDTRYRPIEDYGVIGDMHTIALVSRDGSIDWLCLPRFDSPSVFGALLDAERGGWFRIYPTSDEVTYKQVYWPDTNVLLTRFLTNDGAAELTDFMPVGEARKETARHDLIRRVTAVRGRVPLRVECRPAFDYGRATHEVIRSPHGVCFRSPDLMLGLSTDAPLVPDDSGGVTATIELSEGESIVFLLSVLEDRDCGIPPTAAHTELAFQRTVHFWRNWLSRCTYHGRWRETVYRSLLTLKLLTYEPTGAIVAAATTSLPEHVGGVRNWDYRYSWIRDSAFTLYAFLRMGYHAEAERYVSFLASLPPPADGSGPLQIMYGIDGRTMLTEEALDHLDGYRGSRPVRIGNAAYQQLQLDIYGELIDAIYLYDKWGAPISYETWLTVSAYVDWVVQNWQLEDEGIWEVRGGRRHFVYSKLMCWVALDRALRIAQRRSFPCDVARWTAARNTIYQTIMERGWSEERQAFVMGFGDPALDAAVLTMPLVFFVSPIDPRMLSTLDAIMQPPHRHGLLANSLVFRYNVERAPDGLSGREGTFNMCTFWLVEALTRAGRYHPDKLDEARLTFERMLGFANHVGLYAEQTGARGEALGNFPQAFTHLSLISAAFNLDRALGTRP